MIIFTYVSFGSINKFSKSDKVNYISRFPAAGW